MRNLLVALLLPGVFCPALLADQVTLKNGDRMTGAIVWSDGITLARCWPARGEARESAKRLDAS